MLKRILKSKWFWIVVLILAATGGAWLYLSRNPNFIEDLRSRINRPQDLPQEFDISDVIQYEDITNWDFERDPVIADIVSVDSENQTMGLTFILPTGFITERFSEGDPDLTVKIGCTKEESSLYVTSVPKDFQATDKLEAELQETGIGIFSEAGDGDYLVGLCANEKCSEINRGCQLHRIVAEE